MIDTLTTSAEYRIHEDRRAWLLEKLEKINRKAVKLGLPAVIIEWTGELLVPHEDIGPGGVRRTWVTRHLLCTVTGSAPCVNGWTFVATLQHADEAGTIIRSLPGLEAQIPLQYRTASRFSCDHCQTVRNRRDTYLLRDGAGAFKQVGGNCLCDFLGGRDPHAAAAAAAFGFEVDEIFGAAREGRGDGRVYLEEYLTVVAAVIRVEGRWTSRKAAQAYNEKVAAAEGGSGGLDSTAQIARSYMFATDPEHQRQVAKYRPEPVDQAFGEAALAWTRETFHSKAAETRSDFEHNLVVATTSTSVDSRNLGIAAAAAGMYYRHLGLEAERRTRAELAKDSQYFGTVGARSIFSAKLLQAPKAIETQFGTTYLHKLVTPEGNLVTWFASGILCHDDGSDVLLVDAPAFTVLIGTVKKHDNFRDEKQTVMTRVAVPTQKQLDKASGAVAAKKKQAKAAKDVEKRFEQQAAADW